MVTNKIPADFDRQYKSACDEEAALEKELEKLRKARFKLEAMIPAIKAQGGSPPRIRADLAP